MGAVFHTKSITESNYEVYVYDTERVTSEYDDPLSAVLFHYPKGLDQEHVLLISGQLAGIAHFFSATFGEEAKFFQLDKGKTKSVLAKLVKVQNHLNLGNLKCCTKNIE